MGRFCCHPDVEPDTSISYARHRIINTVENMRDTIIITRNLGIDYLQVDTLYIIQDPDDLEKEAMSMVEAYTRPVLAIAATSSSNR